MYKYTIKKSAAKSLYVFLKKYEGEYNDVFGFTPIEVRWEKNVISCFSRESISWCHTLEVLVV